MIAAFTLNVSIDRRYVVQNSAMNKVNRVQECVYTAGGKGLNVARVIHVLGEPVIAGGIAGGDAGRYILRRLDEEGIAHHFTQVQGESRSCINICDTVTGTQTEYLEPGSPVSEEEQERFLQDYDELLAKCSVLTISGSMPKGMPADTYAKLIERARKAGKPVLLDTSGAALTASIASCPYYIKPNEDEIGTLTDCGVDNEQLLAEAAMKLHKGGIDRVVVSMGSRGALMACSEGVFRGQPPAIKAVNTVGCGDSMTAAFAVAAERGLSAEEALRLAVGVSCASALNAGTGGFCQADYDAVAPGVQVWRVEL